MSAVIEAQGLAKVYRRFEKQPGFMGSLKSVFHRQLVEVEAVSNLDLTVTQGEFVGLIGPNGAGKTTLVKLLSGIIRKTGGELRVLGYDPNRLEDAFKRRFALVMGQKSQLFMELSAADTFLMFKEIYDIPEGRYRRNLSRFVELLDVGSQLNVMVRTLSLGERMKMELIAALLHGPELLFLDEPTIGLDAMAQKNIRRFLGEVNREQGTTILLTSHYMEDIRSLCRRCVVVNHARKIYDGELATLFDRCQTHRVITVRREDGTSEIIRAEKGRVREVLAGLLAQGSVRDVSVDEEDIGEVVHRIYEGGGGA